jgi:glycerol dehydrogenase
MPFHSQIFAAPGRYVQGAGAINEIGEHIAPLGGRVLAAGGSSGLAATREGRNKSFSEHGITQFEDVFHGETCDAEINRLTALAKANACDVLLASGGGKVIDTVKAAAENLGICCVIVPTIASNDSPCSALSVIYNEDGTFHRLLPLKKNPDLVLVDTSIIAKAPVRQLVAGMGDAVATWFEADACMKSDSLNNSGGHISITAITLAKLCLDILLEYGPAAKLACENQAVTPALEKVVEANTLLSGLGFESGGVAVAHALSEGFSVIPDAHHYAHGEKVAFGLLVHMIIENRPSEMIDKILRFCIEVGLPVTLADIGCGQVDRKILRLAAETAAEPGKPSHNMPFRVTGEMIYHAMIAADAMGRKYKSESK